MLGMLRIRVDEKRPRERIGRIETMGGVSFYVQLLHLRTQASLADRMLLWQAVRALAAKGVQQVAAPQSEYIKTLLTRNNMKTIPHFPLLRKMTPQIIGCLLAQLPSGAVLLSARTRDNNVTQAAHYAAQCGATVMLDMGGYGEFLRRELMDEYGVSALLGAVACGAEKIAALLFDTPRAVPRNAVSVALCEGAAVHADYDDLRLSPSPYAVLWDTDAEAVMCAVTANMPAHADTLAIEALVKAHAREPMEKNEAAIFRA